MTARAAFGLKISFDPPLFLFCSTPSFKSTLLDSSTIERLHQTSCRLYRDHLRSRVGVIAPGRVLPHHVPNTLDRRLDRAADVTTHVQSPDRQHRNPDGTADTRGVGVEAGAAIGVAAEGAVTVETSATSPMLEAPRYVCLVRTSSVSLCQDKRLTCRMQIVVERLTKNVNEDHLYEIFGEYGRVKDLDLPISRQCESGLIRQLMI